MAGLELWVPALGFRWIDPPPGSFSHDPVGRSDRWLFPAGGEAFPTSGHSYDPMHADLALFRIFAGLEHSEAAFLDFANDFGYLGVGQSITGDTILAHPSTLGESFAAWRVQVATLADSLDVWDALNTERLDRLNELLKLIEEPDRRALLRIAPRQTAILSGAARNQPLTLYDTAANPDSAAVSRIVRWRLGASLHPGVYPEDVPPGDVEAAGRAVVLSQLRSKLHRGLSADIGEAAPGSGFTVDPQPANLLSALWLAFALEVSGLRTTKDCEWCRRPFQIARKRGAFDDRKGRSDRRVCSDKCGDDATNSRRRRGGR